MITKLNANYSLEIDSRGIATIFFKGDANSILGGVEKVVDIREISENVVSFSFLQLNGILKECVCVPGHNTVGARRKPSIEIYTGNGIEYYHVDGDKHIIYNPIVNKSWHLDQMPEFRDNDEVIRIANAIKKYCGG